MLRRCRKCNKMFDAMRKDNVYCSMQCKNKYYNFLKHNGQLVSGRNCEWCDKRFFPHKLANKDVRYCSKTCGRNAWIHESKVEAIRYYSKNNNCSCECCGENNLEFLTIDHIWKNGNTHRKEIKMHIYQWLKVNNYPEGFRVLCLNCNCAEGFYGYCPHKIQGRHGLQRANG